MKTSTLSLAFLAAALALGGCATTGLSDSWIDPSVQTLPRYQKVFVAYLGSDPSVQRVAEDALAKHLRAPHVERCYVVLPDARAMDSADLREHLRKEGFEAAVLMRVTGVDQEVSWTSSSYPTAYRSFGGYWGWTHETGSLRTDEIVNVETNLYSLADDKLLYAARSETFNPDSTKQLIDEIAAEIADDLAKKGVLSAPEKSRSEGY